ncbi:MAG TPA: hypothetical protein VN833_20185 [Candidatus Acidoferrales bacterium]|nr:hypothetical protein [Candidatus Acidoferrales bacterium]
MQRFAKERHKVRLFENELKPIRHFDIFGVINKLFKISTIGGIIDRAVREVFKLFEELFPVRQARTL